MSCMTIEPTSGAIGRFTGAPGLRLDRDVLERWADFDAEIGIVDQRPDVARAFDFDVS